MRKKSDGSDLISRDGQDVRKAFVEYRRKLSPTGHFVLQPRSDVVSLWNKAGRMSLMFGLPAPEFVSLVFEGVSLTKRYGLMPNSLCGKFAALQVFERYGVEPELEKDGMPTCEAAGKVVRKVMGFKSANLATLADPSNALPTDLPLSGWFASLWTSMRTMNQTMMDASGTMVPENNKKMFSLSNGLYPLDAKAILLAFSEPTLRMPVWEAYLEEVKTGDPRVWTNLKTLTDVRVARFVVWARIKSNGQLR